jgi:hypothetical protein
MVDHITAIITEMGRTLEFMEKSVSTLINNALITMDKQRLKYPGQHPHTYRLYLTIY